MKKLVMAMIGATMVLGVTGCSESISKITTNDLTMNVDETEEINILLEPEGMDIKGVSCKISDDTIAKIEGVKVTGLKEGTTTYTCSARKIESTSTVVITMTEEQKIAKEEADKLAKEQEEAREKEKEAAERVKNATTGQKNALSSAKRYLSFSAFSYSGLIKQLEFEGYSNEDATFAVENCGADWNKQAEKKAQNYLSFSSFSRQSLINQLMFEGFTQEQAEHGVTAVGY